MKHAWQDRRSEEGQALALVLVFIVFLAVVVGVLLAQIQPNFSLNIATQDDSRLLYGADGGIEWAKSQLQANPTTACVNPSTVFPGSPNLAIPLGLGANEGSGGSISVNVSCQTVSGSGSNTFGGYAVVTGVNYFHGYVGTTTTPGPQNPYGSTSCDGLTADLPGQGGTTQAHLSGTANKCVTYTAGTVTAIPSWVTLPQPTTQDLNEISVVDPTHMWAVGKTNTTAWTIFFFDGSTFNSVGPSSGNGGKLALNGVYAPDTTDVYAVGGPDVLYCHTAGGNDCTATGATWTTITLSGTLTGIYGTGVNNLWAATQAGTIYHCSTVCTLAANWMLQTLPGGLNAFTDIFANGSNVWAVDNGQILSFNGTTWNKYAPAGLGQLNGIRGILVGGTIDLWAVGNGGLIYSCSGSSCAGASPPWTTKQTVPAGSGNLQGVSAGDANDVWAVGASGGGGTNPPPILFCSSNCTSASATWTQQAVASLTTAITLNAVAVAPGSTAPWTNSVWAVGTAGSWETYSIPAWSTQQAPSSSDLNDLSAADTTHVWTVGAVNGSADTIDAFDGDDLTSVGPSSGGTTLTGVYSPDATDVYAVGGSGKVLYCQTAGLNDCTSSGATWTTVTLTGSPSLTAIAGTALNNLWAASATTIYRCTTSCTTASNWVAQTLPGGINTGFTDIFANGSDVWVATNKQILSFDGTTWNKFAPSGAAQLNGIAGEVVGGTLDLWAVGANGMIYSCSGATCAGASPPWTAKHKVPSGTGTLEGVAAADANDVWVVGANSIVLSCTSTCASASAVWVQQLTDLTSAVQLNAVRVAPGATSPFSNQVWVVGASGTWLTYGQAQNAGPAPLAGIKGGPVYNADGLQLLSPLGIENGNFTQYSSSTVNCAGSTTPNNLSFLNGYCYNQSPIPSTLQSLDEPLPNPYPVTYGGYSGNGVSEGVGPSACLSSATPCVAQTGTPQTITTTDPGCPSYSLFAPGFYNSFPKLNGPGTFYFESGVYVFNGSGGALQASTGDSGYPTNPTLPQFWVIGGQPSTGDVESVANGLSGTNPASPCWKDVKDLPAGSQPANSWFDGGTGVEWIAASGTWWDVHTVNMELFTREGGASWEGAQGVSIREVPPACPAVIPAITRSTVPLGPACVITSGTDKQGWVPSSPGGQDQIFQVDSNGHFPAIYVHGKLYMPDHNIEEFTNSAAVTLGAIDCNSIELSFESASSPSLTISAGSPNLQPQFVVTSTASGMGNPLTENALVQVDETKSPYAVTVLNWWVTHS